MQAASGRMTPEADVDAVCFDPLNYPKPIFVADLPLASRVSLAPGVLGFSPNTWIATALSACHDGGFSGCHYVLLFEGSLQGYLWVCDVTGLADELSVFTATLCYR